MGPSQLKLEIEIEIEIEIRAELSNLFRMGTFGGESSILGPVPFINECDSFS